MCFVVFKNEKNIQNIYLWMNFNKIIIKTFLVYSIFHNSQWRAQRFTSGEWNHLGIKWKAGLFNFKGGVDNASTHATWLWINWPIIKLFKLGHQSFYNLEINAEMYSFHTNNLCIRDISFILTKVSYREAWLPIKSRGIFDKWHWSDRQNP